MSAACHTAADKAAVQAGFTSPMYAWGGMEDHEVLMRPGQDLDTRFKAWSMTMQEFITIHGYNVDFEPIN